jgi:hypothetical protein
MKSVLQAFISSRLDYCNVLYAGLPLSQVQCLQRIQNCAARLFANCSKREHITPTFCDVLHWLPVYWWIQFKIALLTYKTLHGQSAVYMPSLCVTAASAAQTTLHLRSYQNRDVAVSRVNTHRYGDRTFQCLSAVIWNSLPADLRASATTGSFCRSLKTFFFHQAYNV